MLRHKQDRHKSPKEVMPISSHAKCMIRRMHEDHLQYVLSQEEHRQKTKKGQPVPLLYIRRAPRSSSKLQVIRRPCLKSNIYFGLKGGLNIGHDYGPKLTQPHMVYTLIVSKLNILINPCTKNNKLLGILEARVESSRIGF